MQLRVHELALVWLAALGCVVVGAGALLELGFAGAFRSRPGVGIAALAAALAYTLVRRALAAVMLWLLLMAVTFLFSLLLIANGTETVRYGLVSGLGAMLFLIVLGRAVIRDLERRSTLPYD